MKIAIFNLFKRPERNQNAFEVEDELQFHLEMLERKYMQQGMSAAQAKSAALRRFGNLERVKKQCVAISNRNSRLRRFLKSSSIVLALIGLAIRLGAWDYHIARVGDVLIMIAIAGRLLLHVRGLSPSTLLSATKEESLSVITAPPEDRSKLREA